MRPCESAVLLLVVLLAAGCGEDDGGGEGEGEGDRSVAGAWFPGVGDGLCGLVLTQDGSTVAGTAYGDGPDEQYAVEGSFVDPDLDFQFSFEEAGTQTVQGDFVLNDADTRLEGTLTSSKAPEPMEGFFARGDEATILDCNSR